MRKARRILAMVLSVLMVVMSTPVYALSNTGVAAKYEYLKTEKRAFNEFKKGFEKSEYGMFFDFLESEAETMYSELGVEVEIPEIKTRKYVLKNNTSFIEMYEDGAIEGYVENEKRATFNVVSNDNLISMQIPELYDKYVSVDVNDLENVARKFIEDPEELEEVIKMLPKGILYDSDLLKIIKYTDEEKDILDKASKKYLKTIDRELLKPEYFRKGDDENITANNSIYKSNVINYEINTKQIVDGIKAVWNEVKNDSEVIDIFYNKSVKMFDKMTELNLTQDTTLPTKEQILAGVDYFIQQLEESASDNYYFVSTLYHKDGKLLKREMSWKSYDEGYNKINDEVGFEIYSIEEKDNVYYALKFDGYGIEDFAKKDLNGSTHDVVITKEEVNYICNEESMDYERKSNEVKNKFRIKFTKLGDNKLNTEIVGDMIEGKLNTLYTRNEISDKRCDILKEIDYNDGINNYGVNISVVFEKDDKINKIDASQNHININEKTKEELQAVVEKELPAIQEKVMDEKFLETFYYEEIMKQTMQTMERVQDRANKAFASQIGKATRVWYTDYTTDSLLYTKDIENIKGKWIKYSDLDKLDEYISTDNKLKDGYEYYVGMTTDKYGKIAVGVSKTGTDLPELNSWIAQSSEIKGARVLYVEP